LHKLEWLVPLLQTLKLPVRHRSLGVERGHAALLELIGAEIAGLAPLSGGNSFVARKAPDHDGGQCLLGLPAKRVLRSSDQ
jgi:hypothetical protein